MSMPMGTPSAPCAAGAGAGGGGRDAPGGQGNRWEAGDGGEDAVAVGLIELGERHDEPLLQRIDQCVEPVFGHDRDELLAGALVAYEALLVIRILHTACVALGARQEFLERRLVELLRGDDR